MEGLLKVVPKIGIPLTKVTNVSHFSFNILHRLTTYLLLAFVLILNSQDQIKCTMSDPRSTKDPWRKVINTYCFFMETFSPPNDGFGNNITTAYGLRPGALNGIGPVSTYENVTYNSYYQWVYYVLCLQALTFYIPHWIWSLTGGKSLNDIVDSVGKMLPEYEPIKSVHLETIERVFPKKIRSEQCKSWFHWLVFCEALSIANVFLQMALTDFFLGGQFWNLGSNTFSATPEKNPLDLIFPKIAKCTFRKYGPSGSLQNHDALCVLSLNIVNEKTFVILWWWYISLIAISVLILLHRFLAVMLYNSKNKNFNKIWFRLRSSVLTESKLLNGVMKNISFTEWFALEQIVINIKSIHINILLHAVLQDSSHEEWSSEETLKNPNL